VGLHGGVEHLVADEVARTFVWTSGTRGAATRDGLAPGATSRVKPPKSFAESDVAHGCVSQAERVPTATTPAPEGLSREQRLEMMQHLRHVRSVELKVTIQPEQQMALRGLHLDTLQGKLRQVIFFYTPELTLFNSGVAVRARRTQGALDDTVVKLRPATLEDLPAKVQQSPNLKVEMDVTRAGYVVSASLKGESGVGSVLRMLNGDIRLEKLYSKEQRAFFAAHAPEGVGWTDLVPLGPIHVVVLKYIPDDFKRKLTVEQWHYPGEIPLIELSTKCTPEEVLKVGADAIEFVQAHGLGAAGEQQPKTRKALEFFIRNPSPP